MKDPKLIALDIGNVCVSIHPERLTKKMGLISALFYSHKIFDREKMLERGEIYSQEWLDNMMAFTKGKYSAEELRTAWDSIIGDPIPGMKEAMRRAVAKGYRFVFFSNTSAMHMQTFLSRTELAGLVSGAIFSFDVSSMKPDPVIYEEFEKQYGIPGFYFDDNKDNIAAGKARGWNAILFHSSDQLDQLLQ